MTYTEQQINNYITGTIDRMRHTIEYGEGDGCKDWDPKRTMRWIKNNLKDDLKEAYGALSFTYIYLKGIEQKTFDDLNRTISDTCYSMLNEVDDWYANKIAEEWK